MTTNRLAKSADPAFDRSKWSLQEHCEYANAQLILNDTNEARRRKGLAPVRWAIRDGRVMIENAPLARIEAFGRDHATGLDAKHESRKQRPNKLTN